MLLKIQCLALTLDQGLLVPPALAGDSHLGLQPGNGILSHIQLTLAKQRINLSLACHLAKLA